MSQHNMSKVEQNRANLKNLKWPLIIYGIIVTAYLAYLPKKWPLIWFSWHPILSTLAFVPFATHAVLLKKVGGYENTKMHGIIMSISTILAGFAFYVIYTNKNQQKKKHFTSTHGQGGLATLILYAALDVVGFLALHPDFGFLKTNQTIRFAHKWAGKAVIVMAWLSCIFGFAKIQPDLLFQCLFTAPLLVFGFYAFF